MESMTPSIDPSAASVLATALAAALADPRSPAAGYRCVSEALLEAAFTLCAAARGEVLAPGERLPEREDAKVLARILRMDPARRERLHRLVFGLLSNPACPPYETEYLPSRDATHRAQHLADLAGFYAAFGVAPGGAHRERHDHVALVLEFLALLHEKLALENSTNAEAAAVTAAALRSLLADHVVWWLPTFAAALERRCGEVARYADGEDRDFATALAGTARALAAFATLERLAAGLPVGRQSVRAAPAADEDACTGCGVARVS